MRNFYRFAATAGLHLLCWLVASSAIARADTLVISRFGATVSLEIQGAESKDYRLESTSNLSVLDWQPLVNLATDGTGHGQGGDASASGLARRFYRAVLLPLIEPTTTNAAGTEDTELDVTLAGNDPVYPGSALGAVITQLPVSGQLYQQDGSPITAPNTAVTDSMNQVRYLPAANANGSRVAAFRYFLRRVSNGVTSPVATVGIDLTPVNDHPVATTPRPQGIEDTELRFRLTAFDPDQGDTLRFKIIFPAVSGRLYQVNTDNMTKGAVIYSQNVFVTNPSGYLIYVPAADANGYPAETFSYIVLDSQDAESPFTETGIDIAPVNDAPVARALPHTGQNNDPGVNLTLDISDVEGSALNIYFTALPAQGTLYYQTIAPQNAVVVGQAYPVNSFAYVSAHPYDAGSPYAQFSYYVKDSEGLSSATVTDPINLIYVNTPPSPTTPSSYTLSQNTTLNFNLAASDPDGDHPAFFVTSLPQHGKLYFRVGSNYVDLSNQTPPFELTSSSSTLQMRYIPAANYNNTQGPDSFRYKVRDQTEFNPTEYTVNFNVTP